MSSKDAAAKKYGCGIECRKRGGREHRTLYTRARAKGKIARRRECVFCGYRLVKVSPERASTKTLRPSAAQGFSLLPMAQRTPGTVAFLAAMTNSPNTSATAAATVAATTTTA